MRKTFLLSGAAIAALALAPAAFAQSAPFGDTPSDGDTTVEADIYYGNDVRHRNVVDIEYTKDLDLVGDITVEGTINVDSSAVAVIDNKQIMIGNTLRFREETSTDGASGNVDGTIFGAADVLPAGEGDPADAGDATIDIGFFAPIINTVEDFAVRGSGNVGVNIAAGYHNIQENVAALAQSNFDGSDTDEFDSAGWAEASLTSLQASGLNSFGPDETLEDNPDTPDDESAGQDFRNRDTVGVADVTGNGNIGVNAAAGAFNLQKNAMALAVATDSALAEANAAVIQTSDANTTIVMDAVNLVEGAVIGGDGSTGNIGVNLAAGVGNIQMNSLVAAASLAAVGTGTGGGGPGSGGGSVGE